MKAVNKLAILLSLSSFAPLFASAKSVEQAYLASYHGTAGSPVPVAVVSPHVVFVPEHAAHAIGGNTGADRLRAVGRARLRSLAA